MTTPDDATDWLLYHEPRRSVRMRLFCFHHAGGGASMYRSWPQDLPDDIGVAAVQLPGREFRLKEPCITELPRIVTRLTELLGPLLDRPYALFGHSMGASIAFELAHELRRCGQPTPVHLGVSARIAPHLRSRFRPMRELSDAELIEQLRRVGGIPAHVAAEPELMALVIPLVRADYEIVDNYRYEPEEPLDCPVTGFWGRSDILATESEVRAWGDHTRGGFDLHELPGDHFFVNHSRSTVQALLLRGIEAAQAS